MYLETEPLSYVSPLGWRPFKRTLDTQRDTGDACTEERLCEDAGKVLSSGETNSAHTVISDFQRPEPRGNKQQLEPPSAVLPRSFRGPFYGRL